MAARPLLTLPRFLSAARRALRHAGSGNSPRLSPLTFVVGNESADIDSICSALVLAYFRTLRSPYTVHIPLANLPREDLKLRAELKPILNQAGLTPSDVLTLSDLPDDQHLKPEQTRWLLVDHNVPTGMLATRFGRNRIIGCIDHHDNEGGEYLDVEDEQPKIVKKSGSCMSLVVEYVAEIWKRQIRAEAGGYRDPLDDGADALDGQDEVRAQSLGNESNPQVLEDGIDARRLGAQLAYLAIAPIIVDTANMTDEHKVTPTDSQSLQFVSMFAVAGGVDFTGGELKGQSDTDGYYDELMRLKSSVSGLSYRDVFRKDYKAWEENGVRLGISSTVSLEQLLKEVGDERALLDELRAWAGEKNLDIVVVMTAFREDGRFQRELLIWALNERAANITRSFGEQEKERLGLEIWQNGKLDDTQSDRYRRVWTQHKLENSRKQVAPMLRKAMRA